MSLLVAGADEAHLLSALEARRSARAVTVVTGDGSVGQRGTVADVVGEVLQRSGAAVVYAAGPVPTLHAVAAAAEARRRLEPGRPRAAADLRHRPVPGLRRCPWSARAARPAGPRLRRRPGVPRRPGRLGPAGRAGMTPRPSTAPVMVAAGCGGTGRELASYGDLRARRLRHPLDHVAARPGGPPPADPGDPVRAGPRGRTCRTPASTSSSPSSCRGWCSRGARVRLGRRPVAGGVRRAGPAARPHARRRRRSRSTSRAPDATGPGSSTSASPSTPPRSSPPSTATCRAARRCWPSCAPTWSGSRRAPARCSTRAPTRSWSATHCPRRCPTDDPPGSAVPRSGRWRCAAWRRCIDRRAGGDGGGAAAASPPPTTSGRSSTTGPPPSRSGTALLHDPTTASRLRGRAREDAA